MDSGVLLADKPLTDVAMSLSVNSEHGAEGQRIIA